MESNETDGESWYHIWCPISKKILITPMKKLPFEGIIENDTLVKFKTIDVVDCNICEKNCAIRIKVETLT